MQTRSHTAAKKRAREVVETDDNPDMRAELEIIANPDFDVNSLLEGLTFSKDGKYVVLDSKLLKRLRTISEPEEEEEEERPNPFEHVPEFLDVMQPGKGIELDFLEKCSKAFNRNKNSKNMAEMIGNLPIDWLALRRSEMKEDNWEYNVKASVTPRVTDQLHSGRCWIYASLNQLRYPLMRNLNLDYRFEFSAAYLFFYDKIERANFFLEAMWSLRDRELDDRYVKIFTNYGGYLSDGGYFQYFLNLVKKYGMVPKSIYGDSYNCMISDYMNDKLQLVLNHWTLEMHNNKDKWTRKKFETQKARWMRTVHNLMVRFMGEPPKTDEKFDWTFKDAHEERREIKDLTPKIFYQRIIPHEHDTKVTIIHDPRHPYYQTHLIEYGNNMVGGTPANFLNLPLKDFKRVVAESLKGDSPTWFACEVGQCMDYEDKTLDTKRFDYEAILGTQTDFDKADMLRVCSAVPSHAMLLVGVEMDESDPENPIYKKWRVENSWGIDVEMEWADDHGYWRMSDEHFDKFTYMAVVDLKFFDEDIAQKMVDNRDSVHVYTPFDAMGTVAFGGGCSHCKTKMSLRKHLLNKK